MSDSRSQPSADPQTRSPLPWPPRFCPRRALNEYGLPPLGLSEGRTYEAWYPFLREEYQGPPTQVGPEDWLESPVETTWRPGWKFEPLPPYGEDTEEVWDGAGEQLRTVISIHKPGTYPARVFYVRQWRDPDGKVFGKTALRVIAASAFRTWLRGERWPSFSPARNAHCAWALTPMPVSAFMAAPLGVAAGTAEDASGRNPNER